MKLKTFIIFICVFLIIDNTIAKTRGGGGRVFGRARPSSRPSSRTSVSRNSHPKPSSSSSSHSGTISTGSSISHTTGHTSGSTKPHQNTNVNSDFLKYEGGGATHPSQTKQSQPPHSTNTYPAVAGSTLSNSRQPGVINEGKQTAPSQAQNKPSAPIEPSAPWSNPHLGVNTPSPPSHNNIPWSNPHLGGNMPSAPTHSNTPWSNPHLGGNMPSAPTHPNTPWNNPQVGNPKIPMPSPQPMVPGSHTPQIGFKEHVYPQTHPTSSNTHFGGHPPYPVQPMPSNNHWSSSAPSHYPANSMPMGNPYSMHNPGVMHNVPSHTAYPQQPQIFAQPAAQPFIPGQTILMVPGQQNSGNGLGQMIKEALVFSTINAGVNRILNPHTHTHYVPSKPDSTPTTTTHITYNNQYFNNPPGVNGTSNPANMPQGVVPGNNYQNGPSNPVSGPVNNNAGGEIPPIVGGSNNLNPGTNIPVLAPGGNGIALPPTESPKTDNTNSATSTPNTLVDQNNGVNNINNAISYSVSDDELLRISEELFRRTPQDMSKYIKVNLQKRVTSENITDEAQNPLFEVDPMLRQYPTVSAVQSLYDSYEYDFRKKLNRSLETRKQENLLIDTFLSTHVMETTMQWLADRGFIDPDDFERKDVLRRIWFTMFSGSTCGFERVFASENYGTAIVGVQDWLYFENQESRKRIDYMGYVDKLDIGQTASLLKLNFQMDGVIRPNATIFVSTPPELEMSLYTICFFARPNNLCPVSLAGTKFSIYTHSFIYFGTEVIDLGLPMF